MKYFLVLFTTFIHCTTIATIPTDAESADVLGIAVATPFEETRLGEAILEGNKEDYKKANTELSAFNTSVEELSASKTSEGKSIFQMLLEVPENKDFFYNVFTSLIFRRVISDIDRQEKVQKSIQLQLTDKKTLQAIFDKQIALLDQLTEQARKDIKKDSNKEDTVNFLVEQKQLLETLKTGTQREVAEAVQKFLEENKQLSANLEQERATFQEGKEALEAKAESEQKTLKEQFANEKTKATNSHSEALASQFNKYRRLETYWSDKHKWRAIRSAVYAIAAVSAGGYYLFPDHSIANLLNVDLLKGTLIDAAKYTYDTAGPIMNDKRVLASAGVAAGVGFAVRSVWNCKKNFQ